MKVIRFDHNAHSIWIIASAHRYTLIAVVGGLPLVPCSQHRTLLPVASVQSLLESIRMPARSPSVNLPKSRSRTQAPDHQVKTCHRYRLSLRTRTQTQRYLGLPRTSDPLVAGRRPSHPASYQPASLVLLHRRCLNLQSLPESCHHHRCRARPQIDAHARATASALEGLRRNRRPPRPCQ